MGKNIVGETKLKIKENFMPTKTREQIYRQEVESLLRDISTYQCIKREQWLRLYHGREGKTEQILAYLVNQATKGLFL